MKKKVVSILCLTTMLMTVFTGCGADQGEETKKTNEVKETKQTDDGVRAYVGGTIFESSLDPIKGAMSYGYPFINEALLEVNPDSEYVGDLATDWKVSKI